jgi:hypothetical protein
MSIIALIIVLLLALVIPRMFMVSRMPEYDAAGEGEDESSDDK